MRVVEAMGGHSEAGREPTWDEAVAAFGTGTAVDLVRPARKIVIRYRLEGGRCHATSPDLTGFEVSGSGLYETMSLVRKTLASWIDPAVELEEITPASPPIPLRRLLADLLEDLRELRLLDRLARHLSLSASAEPPRKPHGVRPFHGPRPRTLRSGSKSRR
ncbi:MAG: hypothetical protein M3Y33_12240 [Actinomycetota bacterium]|nr:hypothetical protein [Actinomycetota bacterium]